MSRTGPKRVTRDTIFGPPYRGLGPGCCKFSVAGLEQKPSCSNVNKGTLLGFEKLLLAICKYIVYVNGSYYYTPPAKDCQVSHSTCFWLNFASRFKEESLQQLHTMNQLSLRNNPLEFKTFRKNYHLIRRIYGMYIMN